MKKRVAMMLVSMLVFMCIACGTERVEKENDITQEMEEERNTDQPELPNEEEDSWKFISGSNYHNNIAIVVEENEATGEKRVSAIDENFKRLFVFPQESETSADIDFTEKTEFFTGFPTGIENEEYFDKNGEYIWDGDIVLNVEGEIIYDISEKYYGSLLGNGYMLVKEVTSGYQQQAEKMGVIDGYGNEIIPINEEFAEMCEGELLLPTGNGFRQDGVAFFPDADLVVDANQGIYFSNAGSVIEYRNGNLLVYGAVLYRDQGQTIVEFEQDSDTVLTLSEEKVISMKYDEHRDEGVQIKTYDLDGNLLSENNMPDIALASTEIFYENGNSALYIEGGDGNSYVTMIDEFGNFLFEPIMYEESRHYYDRISEGLIRITKSETETVFINKNGEEVLQLPYGLQCVGVCKNNRIAVNTGGKCFYVDCASGEYIDQCR